MNRITNWILACSFPKFLDAALGIEPSRNIALSTTIHLTAAALIRPLTKLGPRGAIGLVRRKIRRRILYARMLAEVAQSNAGAVLKEFQPLSSSITGNPLFATIGKISLDETPFFSFSYRPKDTDRPYEYDPLEKKYWPRRHYTEKKLHAPDTPRDVKIVWEINRFKDLPALAQYALITHDDKYASEIEQRILSWIDENPFASTINWASALEISIRLISWTATLILLREAGFNLYTNTKIARSIFEQASYLAADLSIDRIVPTNHLIGEAAGLFLVSSLWDFAGARVYADTARDILEREIIRQTTSDGVSREASSWYHQFVTHFFDLVERVAARAGEPMSKGYLDRLEKMKTYLSAITIHGNVIRYGDCDDGWAIYFEGDMDEWKTHIFGPASTRPGFEHGYFPQAEHVAVHVENSFCFIRGGEFGMGGAGFSSHAHDDFFSPIVFLSGLPVVVDPGTFVYNGDADARRKYRGETAHNGLVVGEGSKAIQRMNFGWKRVRPKAHLAEIIVTDNPAFPAPVLTTFGRCGEWKSVLRYAALAKEMLMIYDKFDDTENNPPAEWRFHLHPQWKHAISLPSGTQGFTNKRGNRLLCVFYGEFDTVNVEEYDFSPSYRVEQKASLVHLTVSAPCGAYEIRIALDPDS